MSIYSTTSATTLGHGRFDRIVVGPNALLLRNDGSEQGELERWLFLNAATVLLADKAGELLSFPHNQFGIDPQELPGRLGVACARWNVAWAILHVSDVATKFIVYHSERVASQLAKTPPCTLCDALGYCAGIEPGEFLAEIAARWQTSGEIPHEVGLALGYPVKDVLGFMGHNELECTAQCGWRVYGNPAPSLEANRRFIAARAHAARALVVAAS